MESRLLKSLPKSLHYKGKLLIVYVKDETDLKTEWARRVDYQRRGNER